MYDKVLRRKRISYIELYFHRYFFEKKHCDRSKETKFLIWSKNGDNSFAEKAEALKNEGKLIAYFTEKIFEQIKPFLPNSPGQDKHRPKLG